MLRFNFFKENQIIKRIRANDRRVLGELYVHNEKMIMNYIITNGGSVDDAKDLLQESIIVLWQKAVSEEFELKAKISTFLLAVTKNKWLAELRKRKPESRITLNHSLPNGQESTLSKLINQENSDQIRKAMDSLQPLCKKVLFLYFFERRTMADIAGILNLANANVAKSKKYQCQKGLEKILIDLTDKIERRI